MVRLGDICTKAASNIRQADLAQRNGKYPIYGASGFIKNVDFYEQDKPYVAVVKDGAGVGRVMYLPAFSSIIGTMQYIIPNTGINARYLAYAMDSLNLSRYWMGATIPHIYFKDYCKEELPSHSWQEQNKIASVLEKTDALIRMRKQQLAKLDELVKARFFEIFGHINTNEKRFPVCKLSELCKVSSSKRIYQKELTDNGIPFLRVSDLVAKIAGETTTPSLFISNSQFRDFREKELVPVSGDILVTSRGTIGKCYIIQEDDNFYFQDGMISWLHHFSDCVTSLYITNLFSTPNFQKQIQELQAGSTVAYLSIAMLNKLDILLPPIELQTRFAAFVEQTDQNKSTIRRGVEKLETLKAALIQKYFR